jgi:hypothetical protein
MMTARAESSATALQVAATRAQPVTMADTRRLTVSGQLGGLFADSGIQRGNTVAIGSAAGGTSLALSLLAAATRGGSWTAAVGLPWLGLVAARELGADLRRLALVPMPGERWPAVVAALLDGVDLLLLGPAAARSGDARRLASRAREQGPVLLVLEAQGGRTWPEAADVRLSVASAEWEGLGDGHGYLRRRRIEVVATGRRAAARERRVTLWLPESGVEAPPEREATVDIVEAELAAISALVG